MLILDGNMAGIVIVNHPPQFFFIKHISPLLKWKRNLQSCTAQCESRRASPAHIWEVIKWRQYDFCQSHVCISASCEPTASLINVKKKWAPQRVGGGAGLLAFNNELLAAANQRFLQDSVKRNRRLLSSWLYCNFFSKTISLDLIFVVSLPRICDLFFCRRTGCNV